MISRRTWSLVLLGASTTALSVAVGVAGCQSNDTNGASANGAGGEGATSASTTQGSSSNNGGATTSTGSSSANGGGGNGTGGASACGLPEHTIDEINTGAIGPKTDIKLKGVVAMSPKWLVYKSNSKGSCLWGVYVSAPGLAETAANSGILVVSYGDEATTNDAGQALCPKLGVDPTGGAIPDDVQPGDVLDIVGKTDYFLPSTCGQNPGESSVAQYQVSANTTACPIVKTGTAAVPKAHLLTAAEELKLSSPSDKAFHDQWGGVKVRIENVNGAAQTMNCPPVDADAGTGGTPCLLNKYGQITLAEGNLMVEDDIFFRGYLKTMNYCHDGPKFTSADGTFAFNAIEAFSTQDYCSWVLEPADKCADFDPSSEDCTGATCPP